jgi:curved DNA-binding protein CbpA
VTYDPSDDFYTLFGVAHDAPATVIKRAYRTLIAKVHPDVIGAAGHAASLKLNEAWGVLGTASKRASYDAARKRHFDSKPRTAEPPRSKTRRSEGSRRSGPRPRPAAAPRTARGPRSAEWWSEHVRPDPDKPGYMKVDGEAIGEAIFVIADFVEMLLKRRRAPAAAQG